MKDINIHDILIILNFLIIGFLISYFLNYKNNKLLDNFQELILILNKTCYHIHHYIVYFILVITLLIGKYISNKKLFIIIFILTGMSIEDLLYKDWYLIKNNCHKKKLFKILDEK